MRSSAVKSFFPSFARGVGASFFAVCLSSGILSCAETNTAVAIRQSKTVRAIAKHFRFIVILQAFKNPPADAGGTDLRRATYDKRASTCKSGRVSQRGRGCN